MAERDKMNVSSLQRDYNAADHEKLKRKRASINSNSIEEKY
jgi:hypothetical protein